MKLNQLRNIAAIAEYGSLREKEIELSLQDFHDEFQGFAEAKTLSIRVMRDEWPAQHSCAVYDLSQKTPIPYLWHVGDLTYCSDVLSGTKLLNVSGRNVNG